ncbi:MULTISPECIES: MFS transporter [Streptomycetaceae]|uniref:Major facilitator superfamily permease n=1 Tax=Streptantibioticus cattleyicolor (strain ATCC 35852 / DSM 46488 / JCM 4925 / NBRC 14057 / NRRL 8057) TaxID=1003195 RepID=F8K362_STREN|nr:MULTISPECIES: MFS transporter [Streptomycetaceae]AEW93775.1 major facilitator superfamily permease [Streptantibioticus cattleyicolor NRRL 8057 = DSM 46488]MYS58461.1 DHA2 family efflux MFS transporter permease subunit [Streptomyces sp. SID5468]CCB74121.1 Putative transmembrane transport protein; putative multidrug efflux protein [Streptantibioticus cattleyicolor NRRL 8057 = DSM 46488]
MTDLTEQQSRRPAVRSGGTPPAWAVLVAACAGQFLVVLDVSVVNVALPAIRTTLGLSATGLQWVVNAYALTFAGFLLLGGRAADLFGRKRVFLTGLSLFTLASLAGGLSHQPWQLLTARAVQGLGAAVLSPATLTILTTSFPAGPARTRAIGTWTAVGAGGGAAGGLVGGVLTDYLSWRWVLLVNVPIGALVLVLSALRLAESRSAAARRLDIPGAVLVTGGVAALAYGIVQTGERGWGSAGALLPLLGGVAVLVLFGVVESRTREPLMPLALFRVRSVSAGNAVMLVCGAAMFSMWYFMSLYLQNVLHYSPLRAGLAFLPFSLSIVAGSTLAPRLMTRFDGRTLAAVGAVLEAAGFAWVSRLSADGTFTGTILGPAIVMSFGAGLLMTPLAAAATSGAGPAEAGLVSGLVNTSRQIGGALGLTVLTTVAADRIGTATDPAALSAGYGRVYLVAAGFVLVATVLVLTTLPRVKRTAQPAEA